MSKPPSDDPSVDMTVEAAKVTATPLQLQDHLGAKAKWIQRVRKFFKRPRTRENLINGVLTGLIVGAILFAVGIAARFFWTWLMRDDPAYELILSGGDSPTAPIIVDDDMVLYLNGKLFIARADSVSVPVAPIRFWARDGDKLRIVASDPGGHCRYLGPLTLHRVSDAAKQPLTAGYPSYCDNTTAGEVFWEEEFTISLP